MKSIVWRTFLSFWGATVVILAVVVLLSARVGQRGNEDLYSLSAVDLIDAARTVFELEGIDGVTQWLSDQQNFPPGVTLYLLDSDGYDILGREITPLFLWPRRTAPPAMGAILGGGGMGPGPARPTLRAQDGTVYSMVVGPAPQPRLGAFGIASVQWAVLLTAVTASAIACLALAGPLRRKLMRLQTAATSFAQGDLAARVNLGTNDEIGAVGQQFDRMAGRIEHMIRSREELFRNVSHEIRSPLARIQVALVLAEEERGEGDENLERIRRETEEIEGMMQQILSLAKLEDSNRQQELEDVDLVEVVSLVVDDARYEGKTRDKSVSWSPPAGSLRVHGLADMLRSAVENVLRNAIAHTPEKTHVDVSLKAMGGGAELRILDRGEGVTGADLEQIFEPFYRRDSAKSGVGIGLAITRTAVSLMKGTVEAAAAPGGGLLVTLKLPLA